MAALRSYLDKQVKEGVITPAAGKDSDAQLKAIPQRFRLEATVNASYNLHFDAPAS